MNKVSSAQCLANYIQDLEYQIANLDLDSLNFFTSGTPFFDSADEARDYLAAVKQAHQELPNEEDEA